MRLEGRLREFWRQFEQEVLKVSWNDLGAAEDRVETQIQAFLAGKLRQGARDIPATWRDQFIKEIQEAMQEAAKRRIPRS